MKLHIKDLVRIRSLIIQNASIDKNSVIRSLVTAFESDNKLEPTNVLSRMLNIQVTESNTQVMQRVKDSGALFATIIPIAIQIFQIMVSHTGK